MSILQHWNTLIPRNEIPIDDVMDIDTSESEMVFFDENTILGGYNAMGRKWKDAKPTVLITNEPFNLAKKWGARGILIANSTDGETLMWEGLYRLVVITDKEIDAITCVLLVRQDVACAA